MRIFILILLLFLFTPSAAIAWERSLTCNGEDGVVCKPDQISHPLFWKKGCVPIYLNEEGTPNVNFSVLQSTVSKSCKSWSNVVCTYLTLQYAGLTNEDRVGFNPYSDENANILVFRQTDWVHNKAIIALTTVTFDHNTGEIVDADIEFNAQQFQFSTNTQPDATSVDVENTVTHELGHVIGLAHSYDIDATMFPYSSGADTSKATLGDDDIEAVCAIYAGSPKPCPKAPPYFEKPPYAMNEKPDVACSVTAWNATQDSSLFLGLLLVGAIVGRRLRKTHKPWG